MSQERPILPLHCLLLIFSASPDTTSSSTYSTTKKVIAAHETDEEQTNERWAANEVLIERLLQKLNRQKRAPVAHGVEMLLAIDHMVYNEQVLIHLLQS